MRDIRPLLDQNYILKARRDGVSVQQIYRREQARLAAINPDIQFTHGAIVALLRTWDLNPEGAPEPLPTYVYGVDKPRHGAIPLYTGQEHLEGDWLVIGDTHFPFEDTALLKRAVGDAKALGIRNMVIAGDIVQGDNASHWPKDVSTYTQDLEMERVAEWAVWFCSQFDIVMWFPGNHDRWHVRAADGRANFRGEVWSWLRHVDIRDIENLMLSEYDRVTLTSGNETWTIAHQRGFSRKSGSVAQKLINQYRSNVIVPHQHYSGVYSDEHGYNVGIEIGGMFIAEAFHYANLNTVPGQRKMTRGWATVVDGVGTLYTPDEKRLVVRPI